MIFLFICYFTSRLSVYEQRKGKSEEFHIEKFLVRAHGRREGKRHLPCSSVQKITVQKQLDVFSCDKLSAFNCEGFRLKDLNLSIRAS
jgi:hypothetical protein